MIDLEWKKRCATCDDCIFVNRLDEEHFINILLFNESNNRDTTDWDENTTYCQNHKTINNTDHTCSQWTDVPFEKRGYYAAGN